MQTAFHVLEDVRSDGMKMAHETCEPCFDDWNAAGGCDYFGVHAGDDNEVLDALVASCHADCNWIMFDFCEVEEWDGNLFKMC